VRNANVYDVISSKA